MENNDKNIQNQQETIIHDNLRKPNYYTTTGKKVGDFALGFLGTGFVASFVSTFISSLLFFPATLKNSLFSSTIPILISIAVILSLIILSFKVGRKFIAIGIISLLLIPLLILGSCSLLLFG